MDLNRTYQEAMRHLAQGRPVQAAELFRSLLARAEVIDIDYNKWAEGALRCYRALQRDREAGLIALCLGRLDQARPLLPPDRYPAEAACLLEAQARPKLKDEPKAAAALFSEAARVHVAAGHPVRAALAHGKAGEWDREAALWAELLPHPRLGTYERGLVHFNHGQALRRAGDPDTASRSFASARRDLREVADAAEASAVLERAFDCYTVLLQIGQELQDFSLLLEGYLHCIRIYREDNLKFYARQYYDDLIRACEERQEIQVAAALRHQAAHYCRSVGLIEWEDHLGRAGDDWCRVAEQFRKEGGPAALSEVAYLRAEACYREARHGEALRRTWSQLAELPLPEAVHRRYRELAQAPVPAEAAAGAAVPAPKYQRQEAAYPEVWHLDLIEWEQDGDARLVSTLMLADTRHADMYRRRALAGALLLHEPVAAAARVSIMVEVARWLGDLRNYSALRPLERMYEDTDPQVRRAVLLALRQLAYPRSFQLVRHALRDEDEGVRQAALEALRGLHFPHAINNLVRIFREHEALEVRTAVLHSAGRVGDLTAGEFLIDVLRQEPPPLCDTAYDLLSNFDNPDIRPLLRRHLETSTGSLRERLEKILRGA